MSTARGWSGTMNQNWLWPLWKHMLLYRNSTFYVHFKGIDALLNKKPVIQNLHLIDLLLKYWYELKLTPYIEKMLL